MFSRRPQNERIGCIGSAVNVALTAKRKVACESTISKIMSEPRPSKPASQGARQIPAPANAYGIEPDPRAQLTKRLTERGGYLPGWDAPLLKRSAHFEARGLALRLNVNPRRKRALKEERQNIGAVLAFLAWNENLVPVIEAE